MPNGYEEVMIEQNPLLENLTKFDSSIIVAASENGVEILWQKIHFSNGNKQKKRIRHFFD